MRGASAALVLPQTQRVPDILRKAYADLKDMAPALFPKETLRYPLAVFRGDALQMVIAEPEWALHAAVAFRALGSGRVRQAEDRTAHSDRHRSYRLHPRRRRA